MTNDNKKKCLKRSKCFFAHATQYLRNLTSGLSLRNGVWLAVKWLVMVRTLGLPLCLIRGQMSPRAPSDPSSVRRPSCTMVSSFLPWDIPDSLKHPNVRTWPQGDFAKPQILLHIISRTRNRICLNRVRLLRGFLCGMRQDTEDLVWDVRPP